MLPLPLEVSSLTHFQPAGNNVESCRSTVTFLRIEVVLTEHKLLGYVDTNDLHLSRYSPAKLLWQKSLRPGMIAQAWSDILAQ
jgi:hypothetical protein